jgi:hypothetical protein
VKPQATLRLSPVAVGAAMAAGSTPSIDDPLRSASLPLRGDADRNLFGGVSGLSDDGLASRRAAGPTPQAATTG